MTVRVLEIDAAAAVPVVEHDRHRKPSLSQPPTSFPRLIEIAQIRRRLVFPGWHQEPLRTQEEVVAADAHMQIVLHADDLPPHRKTRVLALVVPGDRPGT